MNHQVQQLFYLCLEPHRLSMSLNSHRICPPYTIISLKVLKVLPALRLNI
jgi:hypothetical protein